MREGAEAAAAPPNLLVIIADDLGTDGLKMFNSDPRASLPPTPNLDSLKASGVLFRNAYGYPTCSPTRSTILTGRYGFRTGIGYALADPKEPVLRASEITLPEVLTATAQGQPGYRHANIGKWHLSFGASDPNTLGGWQHFSGVLAGALPSYDRWPKTVNGTTTSGYSAYATTDNVNDALDWIGQQGDAPWLLWMAFNAAHTPYHKPDNALHGYDRLPDSLVAIQASPRPYYEAMVEALDTEIGRLLRGVDRSRTTLVFLGDNGSLATVIQPPYAVERGKGTLYQGGIRVPLLIAGPSVVRPGRESTHVVHTVDLYATLLELAGASLTSTIPAGHPVDSRSLVPILNDQPFQPGEEAVLSENFSATLAPDHAGRAALDARFKLIRFDDGASGFYDLVQDPLETTNLLATGGAAALGGEAKTAYDRLTGKLTAWSEAPRLGSGRLGGDGFAVEVTGVATSRYQMQRAAAPGGTGWVEVGEAKAGPAATLTDPNPPTGGAWYRAKVVAGD